MRVELGLEVAAEVEVGVEVEFGVEVEVKQPCELEKRIEALDWVHSACLSSDALVVEKQRVSAANAPDQVASDSASS